MFQHIVREMEHFILLHFVPLRNGDISTIIVYGDKEVTRRKEALSKIDQMSKA
jgi:hypothetical protein